MFAAIASIRHETDFGDSASVCDCFKLSRPSVASSCLANKLGAAASTAAAVDRNVQYHDTAVVSTTAASELDAFYTETCQS